MRKLYILLILVLGPLVTVLAQPTLIIDDGSACTGDSFCLPVSVDDFTNINSLAFDFGYDPAVLTFTGAQSFNPDMQAPDGNLGAGLFDNSTPGIISFGTWETGACDDPSNLGITLVDGTQIFELCFEAIGDYGDQTSVNINASPTPICTRNATGCFSIGVFRDPGDVTLCVRELNITAADVSGNEGDQVCVDFVVDGFDNLNGIQFTVNYDPSALSFANLFPNTEIPNNTLGAYGLPGDIDVGPGNITVVWSYTITNPPNVSVEDGTTMFTVCFDILSDCETSTPITFSGDPTPIEANNDDPENPTESSAVPFSLNPGSVTVNDCDPEGIEINIDCGDPVNLGDIVCVEFSAGTNFDAVRRLEYLMTWNPNILEFVSVDDPNNLAGLDFAGDFDASNADNGVLGLDWEFIAGPPQNLDNQELIYRVCFEVVGVGGDSPVQIVTPGIGVSNGINIGINPTNCVVQVNQPESVVVDFGDISVPLNGSDCVPVTVSNFTNVLSMDLTMNWDENIWLHNGTIQNVNPAIAGANPVFTPVGLSSLGFQIDNGVTPITLADGSVLFEICFDTAPTANPGDCDQLDIVGLPFAPSAITSTSNGDNIGLIVNPGELCVLFPEGFGMTAVSTSGPWLDTVCMSFTVESFDNITSADFIINYPLGLQFVSATPLAWSGVMLTDQPVGTIIGSYTSGSPEPIPDGEVAFEICFITTGDPNECFPVTIQDSPAPDVQTSNGQGSMVITNGEICVEERIVVTDVDVTPPSCPGACDGQITLTVASWAGQGFIGTTWTTESPEFQQNTPLMLDDVCEGMTIYRIFDNSSGVFFQDTLMIMSDGEVPNAVIEGPDTVALDCSGLVLLSAEDQGPGINYVWYQNTVGGMPFGDGSSVLANAPGNYILQAINEISGCTATDTVMVTAPELPIAVAEVTPDAVTCNTESITLIGTNSIGENLTYTWCYRENGMDVEIGTGETLEVLDPRPGLYTLKVTNTVTSCDNDVSDPNRIVEVLDNQITPTACALEANGGASVQEQNCDGTPITFSASCSNTVGMIVDYQWNEYDVINEEFGAVLGFGLEQDLFDLGVYALTVINIETGCADTTFVEIIPNSAAPQVQVAEPQAIDCNDPTVVLNATLIPNDPTFTFEWTATDGGTLEAGTETTLTPTVTSPGTFLITVTNPANACTAQAIVAVADETELPAIEITTEMAELSCFNPEVTLQSTGGDADGVVLQWYQDSISLSTEIPGAEADSLIVNNAGVYIVEAANPSTGCTASDTITVTGQFETPTIVLDELMPVLNCNDSTATVTATISDVMDFTVGEWMVMDGGNILATTNGGLTVEVDAAGTYSLTVTSNVSGCEATQDFVVSEDFVEPTVGLASNMLTINCANEATGVTLDGSGSSTGQDFTYLWENQDGDDPADPMALVTPTTVPGMFTLTVTNNNNGCVADTMVVVSIDTIAPVASIAAVDPIDCVNTSRDLTVTVSNADNFIVDWADPVDPDDQVTVTVFDPATYSVEVINTDNGCSTTAEVTVEGDNTPPEVVIATPAAFDCPDEFVTIDATGSGMAGDFSAIQWSLDGNVIMGANDLTIDADALGEYELQLTLASNGCDATATVNVVAAEPLTLPELPELSLEELACDGTPVRIDASAAGDETDFSTITWTGGDFTEIAGLVIDAQEATTYTLTVVLDSPVPGCENSRDYTVIPDPDTPVADAGADQTALCGIPAVLDGSGSTPPAANIEYEWVGTPSLLQPTIINPSAPEAGTYRLIVTNTDNGCADTSAVVTVNFSLPDAADAGADAASCDDIFDLSGNLPSNGANITGAWTTTSGAIIDMADNPVTMVSGLAQGGNAFTWTLSAEGCPDYSSDDVVITSATAPIANPDFLELEADVLNGEVSLVANDILGGSTNFDITILNGPIFGTFDTTALDLGTFSLSLLPGEFGVTEVTYQICSTECPDLCDTATLSISVARSDNPFVPNTVTPNGDGANDDLVFDVITFSDPDEIPDNELIIFNRWGDIIYQAKPYMNNWNGLNQEGQPIPEATYYYVLRLNISRGEIIRGDITVIR